MPPMSKKLFMYMAAYGGYEDIVRLCYNYDAVDLDEVMDCAAKGGYTEVVRLRRKLGAIDFDRAM